MMLTVYLFLYFKNGVTMKLSFIFPYWLHPQPCAFLSTERRLLTLRDIRGFPIVISLLSDGQQLA